MIYKPREEVLFSNVKPEIDYNLLNECEIKYSDESKRKQFTDFNQLKLKRELQQNIKKCHYEKPTPV